MPHVVNGIGTWYYGKRNVHRLRDVCGECKAVGDLESHDTTLYFVVFFVPLLPLGQKRIFDSCPACGRHRVMPLAKWEAARAEAVGGAAVALRADPSDREAVLEALRAAAGFQNLPLLEEAAEAVEAHHARDAGVLAAQGDVNGYFARHDAAAAAYIASLEVEDDPKVRDQLGLTLLRLGNPAAAAGCFDHVLAEADGERLWMLYQLTVAYQARGMHAEALDLLDRVGAVFPAVNDNKDWKKLRRTSEKDKGRGKPAGKSLLLEGRGAGVSDGSRLKWLLPRLVLPLLLLAFAGWHTWRSLTLAEARPMYLLNGGPKPYTVTVNGTSHLLSPGVPKPVELPEGTLTVTPDPASGVPPAEASVASSFWTRPYSRPKVVLNPDRLALLVKETSIYSDTPPMPPPDEHLSGQAVYEVSGVDYCFEPFPGSLKAKKGSTITKTRLGVVPVSGAETRVGALGEAGLSAGGKVDYGRRWLAADPDDALALMWFAGTAPPSAALPVLQGRLADRPVRVEWHRVYQTTAERSGADLDQLRADYRKLADETGRDPDALYLLARVSDRADALTLLEEATASGKPAARAHYALGYRKLCEADFPAAAAEMAKAGDLAKLPAYRPVTRDALLAAGRYKELMDQLAEEGTGVGTLIERARVCEAAGDKAGADAAAQQALAQIPFQADAALRQVVQSSVAATRAAAAGDAAAYLAAAGKTPSRGRAPVADAILRGEVPAAPAAGEGDEARGDKPAVTLGLILLATPPGDAAKLAAAKKAFLDALAAGDRDERRLKDVLTAPGPESAAAVREANVPPSDKRVYAAAAALWLPAHKASLLALSRKLDFQRDAVSLALRKLAAGKTGPAK